MIHLNSLFVCKIRRLRKFIRFLSGGPNYYALSYSYDLSYSRVNRSIGFCDM